MQAEANKLRVAFQGEPGAFSEAAAVQLLGEHIATVPRSTFDATFRAISEGAADVLLVPVENSLAGSVVRVYDLLLESGLTITAETILPIEMNLIAVPGAKLGDIRTVASHPMALAQCERFFQAYPELKRMPAEDTAGSVREALARGDKTHAAIAGRRAAEHYHGAILAERIQDNAENFTRFVLLIPTQQSRTSELTAPYEATESSPALTDLRVEFLMHRTEESTLPPILKMSLAFHLAHRPGALMAALEPFARHGINLLKIESRPIHGQPWEYQFFIDVETESSAQLEYATAQLKSSLAEVRRATSDLRVLGLYPAAARINSSENTPQK